jgi:transcriptional regulator with XRE-family HTH domain
MREPALNRRFFDAVGRLPYWAAALSTREDVGMSSTGVEFSQLLAAFKEGSGLSYSELGRKAHMSSSTMHRYCTGKTLPPDYQTVIRIATACGATENELIEVLRLWRGANGTHTDLVAEPATEPDSSPRPTRWRWRRLSTATAVLLTVISVLTTVASGPQAAPPVATQHVDGPSWQRARPVEPSLFGVTASSSSGSMPAFRVGSLRFWDSRTRWANLEPQPDVFDWSILDRLVGAAQQVGIPATFVFGGTPGWAAPAGPKAPYDDGSRTTPPDDLAEWDRFVRTLVTRYRGRIEAYEVWVHADDPRYFSGSIETLVEMTRRASSAIRAVDPTATVVCPSMARLWTETGRATLRRFAELRGYDYCDVAGLNLHQRRLSDPPETMIGLLNDVYDAMHDAGVHPAMWNTGATYEYVSEEQMDEQRAIDYATRYYLVAVYGTDVGLQRTYFYNWGGVRLPITLQGVGGPPTRAALAVEELQRWLAHTTTHSCGHGLAINLPNNVWQCRFTAKDGHLLTIRWTHTGTATTTAPSDATQLRLIDGTSEPLHAGDTVQVTETPKLIVHRRVHSAPGR